MYSEWFYFEKTTFDVYKQISLDFEIFNGLCSYLFTNPLFIFKKNILNQIPTYAQKGSKLHNVYARVFILYVFLHCYKICCSHNSIVTICSFTPNFMVGKDV